MNEKTMKTTSKKIEKKITFVTSIMGMIMVNIIWIAGIKESPSNALQPSLTQKSEKDKKEEVNDIIEVKPVSLPLASVSLYNAGLN